MVHNKSAFYIIGFLVLFAIYHFPEFFSAFWLMAVCKIGFLVVAYLLAKAQGRKGFSAYGLSFKSKWNKKLLIGLLLGFIFYILAFVLTIFLGFERIESFGSISTLASQLAGILLMTAVPSLAEDILTRGYIYTHIGKFLKPVFWVLLSSAIYVLNHIWRLDDGLAVLSYLFMLGMVLAYAVWIAKSLWLAFGIHWGANIAFETINTTSQTTTTGSTDAGNWILACIWVLLLGLLVIICPVKNEPKIKVNQSM